jgi:hypothetical protein
MELSIIRKKFTESSTIGDFLINGIRYYYSLEDKDRQRQSDGSIVPWTAALKVYGETAIPYGRYEVITNYSNRFKRVMPLLMNVPDFEGIRIHAGNDDEDTHGCPLIGFARGLDFIGESRKAFNDFMPRLVAALKRGKVFITIKAVDGG